ncbi:lipocalin [Rubrivivax gelatinosus]|nr:lipocalin [Rubrivivax gelatinosus]
MNPPVPPPEADLDQRIAAAEQALVARQRRLVDAVDDLGRRVRHAASPWRLAATGAGLLLAGTTLWWSLRRGGPPASAGSEPSSAASGAAHAVPWVGLLGLVWPLLPARWRARSSPGTVAAVMSIGLPLVHKLMKGPEAPPLATVEYVDLTRYAGRWYEVARLGAPFEAGCEGQPTAHYRLDGDQVEVENRCAGPDGSEKVARGVARVVPDSGNARLQVNFLPAWLHGLPMGWADYQIMALDRGYNVALVGHPSRQALWLLARTPTLAPEMVAALLDIARAEGFAVERVQHWGGR